MSYFNIYLYNDLLQVWKYKCIQNSHLYTIKMERKCYTHDLAFRHALYMCSFTTAHTEAFLSPLKKYYLKCMVILLACMSGHLIWAWCPQRLSWKPLAS